MAYGAWHVQLGIELNATVLNLGHPELPGLWETLLAARPFRPGTLECLAPHDCPRWMLPVEDRGRGVRYFRHYSVAEISELAVKSDEHKATQEYISTRAIREGLKASVEHRASGGKRIKDVWVTGGVIDLACEVQFSYIHPSTVARRVELDQADGDTPLWIANDPNSPIINRAPWSRVPKATAQRIAAGTASLLHGGVMATTWEQCGYREPLCPDTKRKPCGRKHVYLDNARGVHLDQLVIGAATGKYKPTRRRDGRSIRHIWLSAADYERYHDDQDSAPQQKPDDEKEIDPEPRELDYTCRYGTETDFRPEPAKPRDSGSRLFVRTTETPAGATVTAVRPQIQRLAAGRCGAGVTPCGQPARLYLSGWRCDAHKPHTIRCGACKGHHPSVSQVRTCHCGD